MLTTTIKWPLLRAGDLSNTLTCTKPHAFWHVDTEVSFKTYLSIYQIRRRHIPGYSNRNTDKYFFEWVSGHKPPCVNFGKWLIRVVCFASASLQKKKEILWSWNKILLVVLLLPGISILRRFHFYTRRVLADI